MSGGVNFFFLLFSGAAWGWKAGMARLVGPCAYEWEIILLGLELDAGLSDKEGWEARA